MSYLVYLLYIFKVGYIGIVAAIGTFAAKLIRIFTVDKDLYPDAGKGVISAFILAVTIVVVGRNSCFDIISSIF